MTVRLANRKKLVRYVSTAVVFVSFFDAIATAGDVFLDGASAQVVGVDHAFDGGSVLVELEMNGSPAYLLIVAPTSPIVQQIKAGSLPVLWSSSKRFKAKQHRAFSRGHLKRLVMALGRSPSGELDQSVASILLALHAGLEIRVWGGEAVETLSNGNWLTLFSNGGDTVNDDE